MGEGCPRMGMIEKLGDPRAGGIPCPMLSVLVMEDRICPVDGKVRLSELQAALESVGLSRTFVKGLVQGTASIVMETPWPEALDLYRLEDSRLDHRGSLGPIQDGAFQPQWMAQLVRCSSDGVRVTLEDLAVAQQARLWQDDAGVIARQIGVTEITALLLVFGVEGVDGTWSISLEALRRIFEEDRFPEGWTPHRIGTVDIVEHMRTFSALQKTERVQVRARLIVYG